MADKLKIDQYQRNADMMYLARLTNKELCPYRILADWMAEKACRKYADMPLFPTSEHSKQMGASHRIGIQGQPEGCTGQIVTPNHPRPFIQIRNGYVRYIKHT